MKKILSRLVIALFAVQVVSAQGVTNQDVNQLPQKARTFINQHFGNTSVSNIKMDNAMSQNNRKYEVMFANGAEVEFDQNGDWKEIDTRGQAIPTAIIPMNVGDYVKTNYATQSINKIKKDGNEVKVELNNNVKLKFDKDGRFKKMDD